MPATQIDRIDGLTTSVAVKAPCRCATTGPLTFVGSSPVGFLTIDGITVSDNASVSGGVPDRVLIKNQTDQTQNGIYSVSALNWTRALDFDGARDAVNGTMVYTDPGGTLNGDILWRLSCTNPVIFGTTALTFTQLGSGQVVAGGNVSVANATSNYPAAAGIGLIICDASGGAFTVTLPPIATMIAGVGLYLPAIHIVKIDTTNNPVTISGDANIYLGGNVLASTDISVSGMGLDLQAASNKWIAQ